MAGAFEFSGSIDGLAGVESYIGQAVEAVSPPALAAAGHQGVELMVEAVKEHTNVAKEEDRSHSAKHDAGQLRDSIHADPIGPTTWLVGPDMDVGNVSDYARMEQLGGQIVATNAPMLLFRWGGVDMSAHSVTHKAQDYLGRGFQAGMGPADAVIRQAISAALPLE
jgi:hypothetical protein